MEQMPFSALLDLVAYDRTTHVLHLEIEKLQKEYATLLEMRSSLINGAQQATAQLRSISCEIDTQENTMDLLHHKERELTSKIKTLSDYRAIKALQAEIDIIKHDQIHNERVLMQLWNKLDHTQRDHVKRMNQHNESLRLLDEKIELSAKILQEKKVSYNELQSLRHQREERVPLEWLECYSAMAARVADPVVPIENDACGGCFCSIPRQDIVRLEKRAILPCKQCFRLLYSPRVMQYNRES